MALDFDPHAGSPAHVHLRRARIKAVQVEQGLRSNPVGVPGFLFGVAVLSGVFSAIADTLAGAVEDATTRIVLGAIPHARAVVGRDLRRLDRPAAASA